MASFKGQDPVRDFIREHGSMFMSVGAIALCVAVAWMMQPDRGTRRAEPLSMGEAARPRGRADYRPAGRSSLDFAPKWGELPLSPEVAPPPASPEPQPEAVPEPEPAPPPIEDGPMPALPDPGKAAELVKKAAAGVGAGGTAPAPVMTAVPSFEKREAMERGEEESAPSGAPANAAAAKKARTMRAVILANQDGSLQRWGLDKETLFALEKVGVELSQYVMPDGTLKIDEKAAKDLTHQVGILRGQADKMPSASGFGY